ncbi:MAG: aminotransferase class I/II-fold pyridoxal phosphate-dependent enzyme [Candidatus Sumerlaeaceae bacterium]
MDNAVWWKDIERQLDELKARRLWRELKSSVEPVGLRIERAGRLLWNFSSNNYLDLATHPHVVARAQEAAERFGAGAGGSRLITGTLALHEELESRLAAFKGAETALVFSSGYLANIGLIQALSRRADGSRVPIVFDKLVHASLVDAILASGAPWKSFAHNDVECAARELRRLLQKHSCRTAQGLRAMIVTEGVFSMDGDMAPLRELAGLAESEGGVLVVDDAHGTGVVGPQGAGALAATGLTSMPHCVQMGTLSKALGSQGGFIVGPRYLRELLVNRARAFIYDTALAPPCVAAALAALEVIEQESQRIQNLAHNAAALRSHARCHGLAVADSPSAIVPVVVGEASDALRLGEHLEREGFLGVAIRPPTVPPGTSRIRLTVMATHPRDVIERLAAVLADGIRGGKK